MSFARQHTLVAERDQDLEIFRIVSEHLLGHAVGFREIFLRESAQQLLLTIGLVGSQFPGALVLFVGANPFAQVTCVLIVFLAVFRHVVPGGLIGDAWGLFA